MKIKICGIRTFADAMMVIESGVDIIGFNFYPQSPRYISPGECMRLVVRLETALREGAEIGFAGFELGNKFPSEPQALAAKLAEFGVQVHVSAGWG